MSPGDESRNGHELRDLLRELRDGQREIIALLVAQRALSEEQVRRSRQSIEESIALQKTALRRQQSVTRVALPGILVCVAAIAYLVLRYF